nr:hypothetical protein [Veillonella denticariosi]
MLWVMTELYPLMYLLGAEKIMETLESVHPIEDISGEAGTNVGGHAGKGSSHYGAIDK